MPSYITTGSSMNTPSGHGVVNGTTIVCHPAAVTVST